MAVARVAVVLPFETWWLIMLKRISMIFRVIAEMKHPLDDSINMEHIVSVAAR